MRMLTSFVVRHLGYEPGTAAAAAAITVPPFMIVIAVLTDMPTAGYLGLSLPWWTAIVSAVVGGAVYFCIWLHQRPERPR
jgi:hypothetical protein